MSLFWRKIMDHEYDYIANLTPEEKRIFVESFCCMVYMDGVVAKEEIESFLNVSISAVSSPLSAV